MTRSIWLLAPALLLLAACTETDDGPDLSGLWQVTAHTENTAGCTPGAAVTDPPYIKFTRENLFGQTYFVYVDCSDAGITCDPSGGLFGIAYADAIPGGWKSEAYVSSSGGGECSLGATISTAVVGADGALSIETRSSNTTETLPEAQCTTEEAKARLNAGTLPCTTFETVSAVRN